MQPKSLVADGLDTRRTAKWNVHHMRGGKLTPINFEAVREKEGGTYTVLVQQELAPMPIRLLNNFRAGVVSVYVPLPAILLQRDGDSETFAGTADYARNKLTSGTSVFGLATASSDAAKVYNTARVMPRRISDTPKVSEAVSFAHASAINYLRRRVYVDATPIALGSGEDEVTPTLYSKSSLQLLNGVLDPDDRINGEIDFTGEIPVNGLVNVNASKVDPSSWPGQQWSGDGDPTSTKVATTTDVSVGVDPSTGQPIVEADMSGASGISLRDFYTAEEKERGARILREIIDSDPVYGEEKALNWAHGLSVNVGSQPFVLYENEVDFNSLYQTGSESTGIYDGGTKGMQSLSHTVPIPQTEFGGIIITFTYVKPDEVIESQPDPLLSSTWDAQNFLEEKLIQDPVEVTAADVDSDVDVSDEDTVVMYTGHNRLKKLYRTGGWSLSTDLDNIAEKSALWQIGVPTSVTPENVIYDETISHYPFSDQNGHAVTVSARTELKLRTPMVFGPLPVETVGIIEDGEVYADE